jgi:hypothetical protein
MDASRNLGDQELNPSNAEGGYKTAFADVRRALDKWEKKTYPNKPKYGYGSGTFCKVEHGFAGKPKQPLTPEQRKARRMARIKRHWDKLPIEEKQRRRAIINERNRAKRKKQNDIQS